MATGGKGARQRRSQRRRLTGKGRLESPVRTVRSTYSTYAYDAPVASPRVGPHPCTVTQLPEDALAPTRVVFRQAVETRRWGVEQARGGGWIV